MSIALCTCGHDSLDHCGCDLCGGDMHCDECDCNDYEPQPDCKSCDGSGSAVCAPYLQRSNLIAETSTAHMFADVVMLPWFYAAAEMERP